MFITISVHIRLDAPAMFYPWKKYEEKHVYHHSGPHTFRCTYNFYPLRKHEVSFANYFAAIFENIFL